MFRQAARSAFAAASRASRATSAGARSLATDAAAAASTRGYSTFLRVGAVAAVSAGAAAAFAMPTEWAPSECASSIPIYGKPGTPFERSFIMVKPDGVARGLIHDIIARWEKRGFTLVGIKILRPDRKLAEAHYADLSSRPFFADLVNYMSSSGPVVAMVWQGKDVIKTSRLMIGATNPLASAPGTVRADLAVNVGRNVIHGSDGPEGAQSEIPLWFKPGEVIDIDSTQWPHHVGLYLYDTKQA